ncbi:hypothetical protein JAAARDRAFT_65992 [Jaapia argillacea MUCL 33604]|uniref:Sensitive to high expression protein 9, mitochondrial n=1 Tax=Jaapia argillacea MUCL 33604 TaxID=933084 RepID=A0A067Q573_9AGAM|nr:hypothetical protein JAAARDRAFT_65992 [Jaapia argillacea MUCL 33604]
MHQYARAKVLGSASSFSSRSLLARQFVSSSKHRDSIRPSNIDATQRPDSDPPTPPPESVSQAPPPITGSTEQDDLNNAFTLAMAKDRLRDWSENAAIVIRKRADEFSASAKTRFSQLGFHLNKVTGYDEIEALKRRVVDQEAQISVARQGAREAKKAYDEAVIQRANSQREVNDLLQRKSTWTDQDVSRFTTLVRQDHLYEQTEARAKAEAIRADDEVEREFSELMRSILARYHEEQVWSDKIRSTSTYGSLAALGLNLVVFILAIVVVEPWKRRRLAQTFERKIEELSEENRNMIEGGMLNLAKHFEKQENYLSEIAERTTAVYPLAITLPEMEEETVPAHTPVEEDSVVVSVEQVSTRTDRDIAKIIATTAAVASIAGWLARSCFSK